MVVLLLLPPPPSQILLMIGISVTRLGDFRKFLVANYPEQVAQMYGDLRAISQNITTKSNLLWLILGNICKRLFQHLVTLIGTQIEGSYVMQEMPLLARAGWMELFIYWRCSLFSFFLSLSFQ